MGNIDTPKHEPSCPVLIVWDVNERLAPWAEGTEIFTLEEGWRESRLAYTWDSVGLDQMPDFPPILVEITELRRSGDYGWETPAYRSICERLGLNPDQERRQ